MEDEWSYGLSGYSYEDVPLFLNSLTQEATGNWQVARPKNIAKGLSVVSGCPSRCASTFTGDHTACQSLVSRGRYHAISEAYYDPYLGDYDSSDLDFDILMLMVNIEKETSLLKPWRLRPLNLVGPIPALRPTLAVTP